MKTSQNFNFLIIVLISALVVTWSYSLRLFSSFEIILEDIAFLERPIDERLLIVAIDNEAIAEGGQWPWPRSTMAKLIVAIDQTNPLAIGVDVIPAEPSRLGKEDDDKLRRVLKELKTTLILPVEADRLYLDRRARADKLLAPLERFYGPELLKVALGHVNLVADRDAKIRRLPLRIYLPDAKYADAFAVQLVRAAGLYKTETRPVLERIVYAGPPGKVKRISAAQVLRGDKSALEILSSKIVLIGATAADLHDEKPTPVDRGTQMSGVEIQAQVANMLLKGYRLSPLDPALMKLLIALVALLPCGIFFLFRRSSLAIGLNVALGLIYLPIFVTFFERGTVLNIVHLEFAWIVSTLALFGHRYFVTERDRRQMRSAFSKYVSKDVLEEILANPKKVKLGGDEKEATVFFSDVRGFTTLSEAMTPTQLVEFLNRYLSRMTDIMLEERGVVDKYIGDAIMGFWGAPIQTTTHAIDAVRAALIMVDALAEFNAESKARGELEIDIGIGLNTGKVTAGNMGSEKRFDYTVMGDTVNLASRLEGQTKSYTIHILISEYTYAALPKGILEKENIVIRELDQIKVKGKKQPVRVFQVVDRAKADDVKKILADFELLLTAYYAGKWDDCLKHGEQILLQVEDGPTKALVERTKYFIEHPPEHWEGVYELKTK